MAAEENPTLADLTGSIDRAEQITVFGDARSKMLNGYPTDPVWMFRALRPEELYTATTTGYLKSACETSPSEGCKDISIESHVLHGSRTDLRSDWISLTRIPDIAAVWAGRPDGVKLSERFNPDDRESSGIFAAINTTGLEDIKNPLDYLRSATGEGYAKGSGEMLVKTSIPFIPFK